MKKTAVRSENAKDRKKAEKTSKKVLTFLAWFDKIYKLTRAANAKR